MASNNDKIHISNNYLIIHSHDGAADDQMALMLLLQKHRLLATILTPADSRIGPAKEMTKKTLALFGTDVSFIVNDVETPYSFPNDWRDEAHEANKLYDTDVSIDHIIEHDIGYLVQLMKDADEKILFIETGPMTALSTILEIEPSLSTKIHKLIWTAGSIDYISSSPPDGCDGSQSWNVYCDPISADKIFKTDIDIVLFTREVTELAILSKSFYGNLPDTLPGKIFKDVYSFYVQQSFYRLWDVMTASYIDIENAFTHETHRMKIIIEGVSLGKTEKDPSGKYVTAITNVDLKRFYQHTINALK